MISRRLVIGNTALVAWLIVVQVAYYRVHKPIAAGTFDGIALTRSLLSSPPDAGALLSVAGDLAVVGALLLLAWLIGRAILRLLLPRKEMGDGPISEKAIFAVALGLAAISLIALTLLAVGWFTLPVVLGLAGLKVACLVVAEIRQRRSATDLTDPLGIELKDAGAGLGRFTSSLLLAYVVTTLALALLQALAPPIAWDSLVYHLTGPKLWVETGRMAGGVDLAHYYFPPGVELLYAVLMLVRSDTAAQALHPVLAALTVTATGLTARRFLGPGYSLPAAALLLSGTSFVTLAGEAYVEWGLMLYTTLGIAALARWRTEAVTHWLVVAGIFFGLCLTVKYTGIAVAGGAGLYVLGSGITSRRGIASTINPAVIFGVTVALVATPWYLRSWILTGNPLYPFVFGGGNWDAWKAAWFSRSGTGLLTEPWRVLLAPWELTTLGVEGGLTYDGTIGPLFLILLPLAAFLPKPPLIHIAIAISGVAYAFWLAGASSSALLEQPRLLYPIFPVLAIIAAWGLLGASRWSLPGFRPRRLVTATVLLSLGLAVLSLLIQFAADTPLAYLAGTESRSAYLTRHLGPYYPLISQLDAKTTAGARVLFLWEPRTYYCPVSCQPDGLLFNWRDAERRYADVDHIHVAWKEAGFTHVLMNGGGMRYFLDLGNGEVDGSDVAAFQEFERRHLERLEGPGVEQALASPGQSYTLYRLR